MFQDTVDHKRHEVVKAANVKWKGKDDMPQWDFMLKRNDGTVCFLHPNWSNNKVAFYEGIQEWIPNGIGSGGNQGVFKRAAMRVDRILKFDKSKTPSGVQQAVAPMDTHFGSPRIARSPRIRMSSPQYSAVSCRDGNVQSMNRQVQCRA